MSRGAGFVFATVFLDMLGFGITAPVLPKLVLGFTGGDAARAAAIFGAFATIFALMQFVCAPLLGVLSDRFGRRPVIVLSNLGLGFDYVLMALAPSVGWLFAGRLVAGITSASTSTASAYVADAARPEDRAAGFGLLGAAFGCGFIAGPALGGLLGAIDPRLPFWCASALSLANALYGLAILPESLPRELRRPLRWSRANPLGALALLRSQRDLGGLAAIAFLSLLAGAVLPTVYVLFVGARFGWDARATGISLTFVGVCSALVQAVLVKPAVAHLRERGTLLAGLACGALGMTIFGIATNGTLFVLGIPVMALWGLAPAAAQSIMAQRVAPGEQGELQGALGSLNGLASLIGPVIFSTVYARSVAAHRGWGEGIVWLYAASLLACAAAAALRVTRRATARLPARGAEEPVRTAV
ncbi:MAG TPA: TCR/Tet family MFS transporter [Candidatus Limnocylindria bacterium]|nr:TCR/Tet family MFS transporter [Candidatus Limnocylindria bacterium]